MALNAAESYMAGHYAAAQALAVVLCDTHIKQYVGGMTITAKGKPTKISYREMAEKVALDESDDGPLGITLNVLYAFAPVAPFLAVWSPETQGPPPASLSRHVTIHAASTDCMTKRNATLAIMLATTLTVGADHLTRYLERNQN